MTPRRTAAKERRAGGPLSMLEKMVEGEQVEFDVWIEPGADVHFLFFSAVNISAISLSSKAVSLYMLLPEAVKS